MASLNGEVTVITVLRQCEEMLKAHDLSCLHGSTFSKCPICQRGTISNIGHIDKLGSFQLDPALNRLLNIDEDENFWTKFKNDLNRKSEKEAQEESVHILTDLVQELVQSMKEEDVPTSFIEFLEPLSC